MTDELLALPLRDLSKVEMADTIAALMAEVGRLHAEIDALIEQTTREQYALMNAEARLRELASAEPVALKGVGRITGDGWKDTTTIGQVVFVWNAELPEPYAPGQFPRIGNPIWSASTDQYDFVPASAVELRQFVEGEIAAALIRRPEAP